MLSTVLVTGGTGFIGSHLVERLVSAGRRVRCLVRPSSSLEFLKGACVELTYGDVATGNGLEAAVTGADLVYHAAGVTKALAPEQYYAVNVAGTDHLLRACEKFGHSQLRLVHLSSLAALGPSASGKPIQEDAPPLPLTHYGASKLESEVRVRHSPLAAQAVIVRPPVVYGPRDSDVLQFFRVLRLGWMLRIGRQPSYFSLIHVRDLVEGLLRAGQCPQALGNAYFFSNPQPVSWTEFGEIAAALMARKARVVSLPYRIAREIGWLAEIAARLHKKPSIVSRDKIAEARCRFWTCDPSKARRDLGFEAGTPVRDGVAETLAWYREAGWLKY